MRTLSGQVPLALRWSKTAHPSGRLSTIACRRETEGSLTTRSAPGSRPSNARSAFTSIGAPTGGTSRSEALSFSSSCHGAGRAMSRHQALRTWRGRQLIDELAARGIIVRSPSPRGVAEEAPGAYKDVTAVVDAADAAGLSRKVAKLVPIICVKG